MLIGPDVHGNYTKDAPLPGGYVTVDGQQVRGRCSGRARLRQPRFAADG